MRVLTPARARELLSYSPRTGQLRWRVTRGNRALAGNVAGSRNTKGHVLIGIDGKYEYAHRVAWMIKTGRVPPGGVVHLNRDLGDNRWSNLRCKWSMS